MKFNLRVLSLFEWIFVIFCIVMTTLGIIKKSDSDLSQFWLQHSRWVEQTLVLRAPNEVSIRQCIQMHVVARGLPTECWADIRALFGDETGCQHTKDGKLVLSPIRNGRQMVGLGQINMAPGKFIWRGWDVRTLEGNIGAAVQKYADAYFEHGKSRANAIKAYQGYQKLDSKRANEKSSIILREAERFLQDEDK